MIYTYTSADDAKLYRNTKSDDDLCALQHDLQQLEKWSAAIQCKQVQGHAPRSSKLTQQLIV